MKDATGESVSVKITGTSTDGEEAEFTATGKIISFHGFLKAYVEDVEDDGERDDRERRLPPLAERDPLTGELTPASHVTRPPARYTEASLVKELEDREIGRPSTYASILGTILDRGYVFKKGTALVPSFLAFAVVTLLERHFARLVDYDFTARMEEGLDEIARGEAARVPWLRQFYFGSDGEEGLKQLVSDLGDIDARDVSSFPLAGSDIVVRVGRYGPYLERDGQRVNVPDDIAPDELTPERAAELFDQPNSDVSLGTDPDTGHQIVAKSGRFGPYVTEVLPEGATAKPRTSSLLKSMALDTVTLEDAVRLLTLPRTLGELDGEPVTAQNGRYGPYVKKGTDSRSLESEEQLFTMSLAEAKELFDQPKARGRRGASAAPLRELGEDPAIEPPDRDQGGPVRPVRDRRRDQRLAAPRRRSGVDHGPAGDRAAGRAAGRGPRGAAAQAGRDVIAETSRVLGVTAVGRFVPEPAVVHRGRLTPGRAPVPAPGLSRAAAPVASRGCRARPRLAARGRRSAARKAVIAAQIVVSWCIPAQVGRVAQARSVPYSRDLPIPRGDSRRQRAVHQAVPAAVDRHVAVQPGGLAEPARAHHACPHPGETGALPRTRPSAVSG